MVTIRREVTSRYGTVGRSRPGPRPGRWDNGYESHSLARRRWWAGRVGTTSLRPAQRGAAEGGGPEVPVNKGSDSRTSRGSRNFRRRTPAGGTVVGSPQDLSTVYYKPGGLPFLETQSFLLSALALEYEK